MAWSVIKLLQSECVILGGGVIEAIDLLYERASRRALTIALSQPAARTKIVRTKLGDFSGVVGAARIAARRRDNMGE